MNSVFTQSVVCFLSAVPLTPRYSYISGRSYSRLPIKIVTSIEQSKHPGFWRV